MRAMISTRYGGPEVLSWTEIPEPTPGPGQILVGVHATSVNPIDWKLVSGKIRLLSPLSFPAGTGLDVAGVVVGGGPGTEEYPVGTRVHARIGKNPGGAAAERVCVGTDVAAPIPDGMDAAQAAGLPLAGITALQGLRDRAGLPMSGARQRVLVVGASGGVGHLAVQIAASTGATVVGVCSGRNAAMVTDLGAHEVVDYTAPDPYRGQAPFDIVMDCVASNPGFFLPLLGPAGRYATCMPAPNVFLRGLLNPLTKRKAYPVMLKSNSADLRVLDRLFEEGRLRVVLDSRYPVEGLADAWARSMSGRATGKIIVDVAPEETD